MRRHAIDPSAIGVAITAAEQRTSAEIVVAVSPFFVGRIERAARRAFDKLGVAATRGRNGVLLFVVPSRHQVFVLPDQDAEARVDGAAWQLAASTIAEGFARGAPTEGLIEAIDGVADALADAFPPGPSRVDELPDHVIL